MTKNIISLVLLISLLSSTSILSQHQFNGYSLDNFSGYHAAFLNPALIADSRSKLEIGGSFNLSLTNNFNAVSSNIFYATPQSDYHNARKRWYRHNNTDINILGLLVNLDNKNAFSYSWRVRSFTNAHGNSNNFSQLIFDDYSPTSTTNSQIKNLSLQQHSYADHSFSYARVLMNGKRRFFKAGVTLKVLNGINASYLYSSNADLTFNTNNTVNLNQTNFEYGHSQNSNGLSNRNLSVGGDIGFVYEFRPEKNTFKYEMNGNKNKVRHDLNKYKYKIGASLLNVGRLKYTKDTNSYDFVSNNTSITTNNLFSSLAVQDIINTNAINSSVLPQTTKSASNSSTFNVALPTELSLQADYHLKNNYYVAFTTNIPIWLPNDAHKSHSTFIASLTPRYEGFFKVKTNSYFQYVPKKKIPFGIGIPLTVQKNTQFNVGIVARVSSFVFGANNITPILGQRKIYNTNFFMGYKFTIRHQKEDDFDEDKVSDDKDLCFYEKGDWRQFGCPDSDQDGIPDHKDYCPNNFGPKSTNGCPDSDNDGVLNFLDHCPDQKGIPALNGCPDTDRDGIIDDIDRCPTTVGPYQNNGCPLPPVESGCCKDSDGDGVLNKFDKCPEVGGEVTNQGCPSSVITTPIKVIDTMVSTPLDNDTQNQNLDNNKVNNSKEETSTTVPSHIKSPNDLNNQHFDEINREVNDSIHKIIRSEIIGKNAIVYFGNDSHYIEDKYRKKLGNLITKHNLGIQVREYTKVRIIGHTDNVGDDIYNLMLSKKRVEKVRSYLINLGVPNSAIEMYYLGEDAPVTGNQNEIDKALNRRVEVLMIK